MTPGCTEDRRPTAIEPTLDHRRLYRLPWTLTDNTIAWLEPTSKCNMYCEGCYRENRADHKSLSEIESELDLFTRERNFDGVSIAGGDPLTHPEIVNIVRMVSKRGYKPILNTNGMALTETLLRDLRQAGLVGLTFHVDSKQSRPGWKGKSECELNALRLDRAELVARVGGMTCAFNATIYEDTLQDIPDLVAWAQEHIDIVHTMVFILYRAAVLDGQFDYYASAEKIDMKALAYSSPTKETRSNLCAEEVVRVIREREPGFSPAAYLNGTEKADSFKWLLATRIGTKRDILGYFGPRAMEIIQVAHHLWTGRYLAYASPRSLRLGKVLLALGIFDSGLRAAARRALRSARLALGSLHVQSIMIIQPVDILPDGRQNMCDGCPDMTVHDGRLAWSCRLEECTHFGGFVRTVPKGKVCESEG